VTDVPEDWVTGVLELCDDEAVALWTAMHRGFLTWANPTDLLVRSFTVTRLLEGHTAVVLMPGPRLSLLVASVPDLEWLPALVQQLCEGGAFVQRIMPERGVVSALISGDCAESVARTVAALGIRCDSGNGEGRS
jgi:hypothetical protein